MPEFNMFSPEMREDPYPFFVKMREVGSAVPVEPFGILAVSRYDDVMTVLRNPAHFSSTVFQNMIQMMAAPFIESEMLHFVQYTMLGMDPPDHTRLRRLVNQAFTVRRVNALEPRIRAITKACIDTMKQKAEFDLVAELAAPLPVIVIAEMLGIEPERHEDFRRWSNDTVSLGSNPLSPSEADIVRVTKSHEELFAYLAEVIEKRREAPEDDLISAMIRAEEEEDVLTAQEVMSMTILLLIAGNETTTNLIGNAMIALDERPKLRERIQADLSLIPDFIEEALRYNSPVIGLFREATETVQLGDATVPKGSIVLPLFASANHDANVFENPGSFDIDRANKKHLSFGFGIHYCLGAPLARLEARIAFEEIFRRLPQITMAEKRVGWVESFILRGPTTLPMKVAA